MQKPNLSRRQFIKSLGAATSAATLIRPLESKAQFFNQFGYWKKPNSSASGPTDRSLRFRSTASVYMNRSFTGTPTTYTFSCWVKRGSLGSAQMIAGSRTSGVYTSDFGFDASDQLRLELYNSYVVTTTGKYYRDPTAWIHIVLNVTVSGAINIWVNNVLVGTGTATANSFLFNSTATQNVLGRLGDLSAQYFDGYLSRIAFVDGQALTPDSFGATSSSYNEWSSKTQAQIKTVVDAGGSNSFMLDFDDATFATYNVGKDFSSKGNHWTPNGFNVTTYGTTYDWMLDVPGNSFINCSRLTPTLTGHWIYDAGLQTYYSTTGSVNYQRLQQFPSTGKWYFEVTKSGGLYSGTYYGYLGVNVNGSHFFPSNSTSDNITYSFAIDADSGKAWYGSSINISDVNAGINPTSTFSTPAIIQLIFGSAWDWAFYGYWNFGQAPLHASATYHSSAGGFFRYTPPTGFKALCQANLPTPTIAKPNLHFDVKTYAGTGGVQTVGSTSFYNLTYPYSIGKSLRFNGTSQYLNRTPSSNSSDPRTWTYSVWLKRSSIGSDQIIISSGSDSATTPYEVALRFTATDTIQFVWNGNGGSIGDTWQTNSVFRDTTAWHHYLLKVDVSNATRADRVQLYVDGISISLPPTGNGNNGATTTWCNASHPMRIGTQSWALSTYFSGYMSEICLIDGQALTPDNFGQWDSTGSTWIPKAYTGTYGTNGFYLDLSSGTSLTTLGYDNAPIGGTHTSANNWSLANFTPGTPGSIGVNEMWMNDTPTMNFPNLLPAYNTLFASVSSYGNLNFQTDTPTNGGVAASYCLPTTGRWYWEVVFTNNGNKGRVLLWDSKNTSSMTSGTQYFGYKGIDGATYYTSGAGPTLTTYASNDIIQIAADMNTGKLWFGKNNTWLNSGDPVTGTNPVFTGLSYSYLAPGCSDEDSITSVSGCINFGQRAFTYTPPTGFNPLCTANASAPATTTWMPSLAIVKSRTNAYDWCWADNLRGPFMTMASNALAVEGTNTNSVQKFFVGGIQVGSDNTTGASSNNYVTYLWKGGTPTSNAAGTNGASIASVYTANTSAGFSVVTYNSGTSGDKTVAHGLGKAPKFIITKSRDGNTYNWSVYHSSATTTVLQWLRLNTTDTIQTNGTNCWGSSLPDLNVFGITSGNGVEASKNCVAYCFAEIDGYSKFGTYTGNGSADGPFVWCGFKPKFVMIKRTDTAYDWTILDSKTSTYNPAQLRLLVNGNYIEADTNQAAIDFLSNGLKLRNSDVARNASGGTYIFIAFAEVPAKYALGR